jgi:uncharacterized phage protein (TIGR01671 family)
MSREIKFRIWTYIRYKKSYGFEYSIGLIANDETLETDELMQYTGLKDMNGTEIYEGDIVSFEDDPAGVVKWNSKFCFYTYWESEHINDEYECMDWNQLLKKHCNHYIVHGNIYENTDLLS